MFNTINLLIIVLIAFFDLLFLMIISSGTGILVVLTTQIITAGIGLYFLKSLDFNLFFYIEARFKNKEPIIKELWEEFILLSGACLLIIPGFLSDIIGLLALIADTRKLICDFIDHH
ncbi:MAG: FxsA family protein [Deltaproteobacteria bacterium]|jgi:UPF0716 protein FxsA|nr:FxsA family protein [Deltaproteobacteria bacterium]MBT4527486.1 FxsA family protein [Deltaproteobacteria bacterium]